MATVRSAPTSPRSLRGLGPILVVPVVFVALWAGVAAVLNSAVFPNPLEAALGAIGDLQNPEYVQSALTSLRLLAIAWVLSAILGGAVGLTLGRSRFWSAVFTTPLFALYSIPKVTLYPVFLLLLGLGETGRIAFALFHGFFPMALLVMGATANLDPKLGRLSDSLTLNWWQRWTKIMIPALGPTVLLALRISLGLTSLGLVLAEMFSADVGLGHELISNIANVKVGAIAGQVVIIATLAVIPVFALLALERRFKARAGIT